MFSPILSFFFFIFILPDPRIMYPYYHTSKNLGKGVKLNLLNLVIRILLQQLLVIHCILCWLVLDLYGVSTCKPSWHSRMDYSFTFMVLLSNTRAWLLPTCHNSGLGSPNKKLLQILAMDLEEGHISKTYLVISAFKRSSCWVRTRGWYSWPWLQLFGESG